MHSGSRNLGLQVAKYYQSLAERNDSEREAVIARLKAEGRAKDIQKALTELDSDNPRRGIPRDLLWLEGDTMKDYLHDAAVCQMWAKRNRESIVDQIINNMKGLRTSAGGAFHTIHNYIDTDEMVLRKGAISAKKGEKVIIPLNMRDGSIIAYGKGNPDWNQSAPHGAGRVMSRSAAKAAISISEFKASMDGIYSTSVRETTIDEAPQAYKPVEDIIGPVAETVDIVEIIKPVYNYKAH